MTMHVEMGNVVGLRPVMQTLRRLQPELYREITKELKQVSEPLRRFVADGFPEHPWQSSSGVINWERYGRTKRGRRPPEERGAQFPKYDVKKVRAGVSVKVGGRRRRDGTYPIMSIRQSDGAGQIYDLAKHQGARRSGQFVRNLAREGLPSRVMWRKVQDGYPMIRREVIRVIGRLGDRFSAQIERETELRNRASMRARRQARTSAGRFGAGA